MSTMSQDRFNNPKYLDWVKVKLSLQYAKEGLEPSTDQKVQTFHDNLSSTLQVPSSSSASAAPTLCHGCLKSDLKRQWSRQRFLCPSGICDGWLGLLQQKHVDPTTKGVEWDNFDVSRLPTTPWECAKVYMPYGSGRVNCAGDADLAAILTLFLNCRHFASSLQDVTLCEKVKEVRNRLLHSGTMEVERAQMLADIQAIKQLLGDPAFATDTACQEATSKIDKLVRDKLELSQNKELELAVLNGDIKSVTDKTDYLRKEVSTLKDQLDTEVTSLNDKLDTEVSGLKDKLDTEIGGVNTEMTSLKNKLHVSLKDIVELQKVTDLLCRFINACKIDKVDMGELAVSISTLSALRIEIDRQGQILAQLQETVGRHEVTLEHHKGTLEQHGGTLEQHKRKLSIIESDLQAKKGRSDRQNPEVVDLADIGKRWNFMLDNNEEHEMISFLQSDRPPAKSEVQRAFELHSVGRLTAGTFDAICQTICQQIQNKSDRISSVRTYVTTQSRKVVFVAMADRKLNLLVPYDVKICHPEGYSEEALDITYHDKRQNKQFTENELKEIPETIQSHSQDLFENHSNIQMISGCSVRSRGFGTDKATIDLQTCIVIYVNVKGIIPLHETLLPTKLSIPGTDRKFPVDVREGGMISFSSPNEYHKHLKMGCLISDLNNSGTLGPIIESDMKSYCLTCAHLFCEDQVFRDQIAVSGEYKKASDNALGNILVYQGECPPFGVVDEAVYKSGGGQTAGLDVAVINITDLERLPHEGSFPDGNMKDADTGYNHDSPMRYTSGNVYDEQRFSEQIIKNHKEVVKYGCVTGYTKGNFDMLGQVVKVDYTNQSGHPEFMKIMRNQMHVISSRDTRICPFAERGDSGSLVFAKHNGDRNDLWAVGMVIGGTTFKTVVVTPIWDILNHLRHLNGGLKLFES